MHLVFMTRGHINEVNEFIKFLQTIPFNFPVKKETDGTFINNTLWAGVRPIQLWEVVFPEETFIGNVKTDSLHFLMNTLGLTKEHTKVEAYPHLNKYLWGVRKIMNLNEIPEIQPTLKYPFPQKYVHVIPIGWKKDEFGKLDESPNLEHEKI